MFVSMTGFGTSQGLFAIERGKIEVSVEIRTVNSKFLDIHIRSPRAYLSFDARIQNSIRKFLKRGRVDVNVNVRMLEGADREIDVNLSQARALRDALMLVHGELNLEPKVGIAELLTYPDWLQTREKEVDGTQEWPLLQKVLEEALQKVLESRRLEGQALQRVLLEQKTRYSELYQAIRKENDSLLRLLRDRTRERVKDLAKEVNFQPERLEQEIAIWVARADFREEIDRIEHHLATLDGLFDSSQEIGRKLEFVLQELHRETNTLGTKCSDARVTRVAIDMKTALERMREQIQNVE